MGHVRRSMMVSAIVGMALTSIAASAQVAAPADPGFAATQAQENAANSKAGPRTVPGRAIPVPDTVSPQFRATIAAPYRVPAWDADPKSAAEWKDLISKLAGTGAPGSTREAWRRHGAHCDWRREGIRPDPQGNPA
jgi:epsilon-lactone hydrolase